MAPKAQKRKSSQSKKSPQKKRKIKEEKKVENTDVQKAIVPGEKGRLGNTIIKSRAIDRNYFGA